MVNEPLRRRAVRRALAEGESAVMAVRSASIHLGKLRRINVLQNAGAGAEWMLRGSDGRTMYGMSAVTMSSGAR